MIADLRVFATAALLVATACSSDAGDSPTDLFGDPGAAGSSGAFRITTQTYGVLHDPDGYTILIAPANAAGVHGYYIGTNDSILVTHEKLGAHASFYVQLRGLAANCWPALASWTQTPTIRNQVTPIDFNVDCLASNRLTNYRRLTPLDPATLAFHGTLTERFALTDDGRFRLQVTSARVGDYDYLGTYIRLPTNEIRMAFETDISWEAMVTQRGDSLFVQYNDHMRLSGFESGVFVRRFFRLSPS